MKMKNVNFFQLHVEKLILGGAVLVALVLVLLYVIGEPYAAEIDGQERGPDEIEGHVAKLAEDLNNRLNSETSPIPERKVPQYTRDFKQRVAQGVLGSEQYRVAFAAPGLGKEVVDINSELPRYALPTPPVPSGVTVRQGYAVLGAFEDPELQQRFLQLIPARTPQDFRYVSAGATFDLDTWQKLLEASDLKNQFYRAMIGLTSVYLQREELDPVTGEWTNRTIIQPLPGYTGVLPTYEQEYTNQEAQLFVRLIKDQQQSIARSEFPPLASPSVWLPPDSDFRKLTPEDHKNVMQLRSKIARLERQIQMAQDRAQREAQAQARNQNNPRLQQRQMQPVMPDIPEMGPMGPGGRQPRIQPRQPVQRQPVDEEAERMQRAIIDLQTARTELNNLIGVPEDAAANNLPFQVAPGMYEGMPPEAFEQMQMMYEMGGPPGYMGGPPGYAGYPGAEYYPGMTGQPVRPRPGQPGRNTAAPRTQPEEPQNRQIKVWAHDLTVEPGKTYRYRVLVSVLNPLFRQSRLEENQKRENYNKIALGPSEEDVQASPWSDPVPVDPEYYFFFVQGNPQSQIGRVEVWTIYNGVWHPKEFTVGPGDPVGGEAEIQLTPATPLDETSPTTVAATETTGDMVTINMDVGAVVVDLTAAGAGGGPIANDQRLLYLEPGTQGLASRSAQEDRENPIRIRLQSERAIQLEAAAAQVQPVALRQ